MILDTDRFGVRRFTSIGAVAAGSVLQFTYDGEQKYVGVITPEWFGELHGIDLDEITGTLNEWFEFVDGEKGERDGKKLYDRFKTHKYYSSRPFRRYKYSKVSAFREIYIKAEKKND